MRSFAIPTTVASGCWFTPNSQRSHRKGRLLAGMAVCALAACGLLAAKQKKQPSKVVMGLVTDQAENPVAGAAVELSDLQTGKKLAIYSEEGGHYRFSDLQPTHDYEIKASLKGVASEVRKVSSLDDRSIIVLNLKLLPSPP